MVNIKINILRCTVSKISKNVECLSKINKFGALVHLVGFTVEIL